MKKLFGASVVVGILITIAVYNAAPSQAPGTPAVTPAKSAATSDSDLNGVIKQYCSGCHSETGRSGNLSLVGFDVTAAPQHAEIAEKMIRKLRAGMMPPPGARRPDGDTQVALVTRLETVLDTA